MADLSLVFDLLARDRASSEVANVGDAMRDAGDEADGFGDRVSGMFAGLAGAAAGAGLAVGAAFLDGLERESANNLITAQLGLPPDLAAELGAVAGNLYAANYGESVAETTAAVRATMQSGLLPEDATNAQIESITGQLFSLSQVMEVDVGQAANAAGQLVRTGLAGSAQEAADLLARATQEGANQYGDLADTIAGSAGTLAQFGLSGAESVGLIEQSLRAGAPSADFFIGALEELAGNAGDSAEVFQTLGLNGDEMVQKLTAGGPAAREALGQLLQAMRDVEDPAVRSTALVGLFGEEATAMSGALLALDPATAVDALGQVGGAAAGVDATLASGLGPTLETMKRGLQTAATEGLGALLAGFRGGSTDAQGWQATVQNIGATVSGVLQPALAGLGVFLTGTVQPALATVFGFLSENQTTVNVIAGLITGVLVAAFTVWGTRATISAAQNTAAWFSTALSAQTGAAAQQRSALQVVAGWVIMGVQSMLQAARMAAAWFVALGPVGWVIALVVGLVALIVANWDTVKQWTITAWEAISGAVSGAWQAVTGAVSAGVDAVVGFVTGLPGRAVSALSTLGSQIAAVASAAWSLFAGAVTTGIDTAVGFVSGLPGKLVAAAGSLGTLLVDAGGDLLRGLWKGISGAADWLLGKIGSFFGDLLPGWVRDMLGISSPSRVFAEFGRFSMQGFADGIDDGAATAIGAAGRAALGVTDRVAALTDLGALGAAVDAAMTPAARLGYRAPGYDLGGAPAGAGPTTTINTTINAAPTIPTEDQLSGVYRRAALLAPRRS